MRLSDHRISSIMTSKLDPALDDDFPGKFSFTMFWVGLAAACIGVLAIAAGSQNGGWSHLGNFIGYAILWMLALLYTLIFGAIAWVREYQLRGSPRERTRYTTQAGALYRYAGLALIVFGYLLFRKM